MSLPKPNSCSGCMLSCLPWGNNHGFVPASGEGTSGVLIVAEAAGADETEAGMPMVGKAGHYLFQQLARVGLERDMFRIHNVLSCQPPGNKIVKMPYEAAAIAHCAPNLDATIADMKDRCRRWGKTLVILTLGRIAFKRIMGFAEGHPVMRADYQCYPHWHETYQAWVIAADHPAYLMRGKSDLVPILQFAAQRAVEIATDGLVLDVPTYIEDPSPATFAQWMADFEKAWREDPDNIVLSYDIETPYKSGKDEEAVAREDDDDYTILRCSFAYRAGEAISVQWRAEQMANLEYLFSLPCTLVGWNLAYDSPRVRAQLPIAGTEVDAMLAWHVLNSALPKGLGFVTPFYAKQSLMWKHLAEGKPAYYNAADADMALRNYLGIKQDLIKNRLWDVFRRHVVKLNEALSFMSGKGVLQDAAARKAAEVRLVALMEQVKIDMDRAVPTDARRLKVYKKTPKNVEGMVQVDGTVKTTRCVGCAALGVKATHFKSVGAKRLKQGDPENPCEGLSSDKIDIATALWAKPLDFKVSKVSLLNYQKTFGHESIINRRESKVTFDENALKTLMAQYPNDPLYPLIGRHREYQKLLSTYVGVEQPDGRIRGGLPIGKDERVHTTFSHNPSTLRLASQNPNLQNLPRPGKNADDLASLVRNFFVAAPGHVLVARDFSGIEAVLVGYEARSARYIRLAKLDVHSFYTAYALNQLDGRVSANDLPDLSWDDARLTKRLSEIKSEFKHDRNSLYKHLTHAINFGQGPKGAQEKIYKETDIIQPLNTIATVMGIYKELFPEIPKWHHDVRLQADRDGYLRNAFGYVMRFNKVFSWKKVGKKWDQIPGDDAQRVLAAKPQSNAAGIIKESILRLYFDRFEDAGQYLRLQVHDENFMEVPMELATHVDQVMQEEMERPVPELKLPASWGMGEYLSIGTEGKIGARWGEMK